MPPPIQIIPANPSFGTLLAQHLGQAAGDIGQGFLQGQQEKQKRAGTSTLLKQIIPGISDAQANMIAQSGVDPKDIIAHADKIQPQQAVQSSQDATQKVFDEMSSLLAQGAPGIGVSPLTKIGLDRKGVENRAYFDTMRARFEATLLPLVNKGALSQSRFDYILSNIPKASDSQRAIYGKLKALSKDLNLDPSALGQVPFAEEEQTGMSDKKLPKSSFAKPSEGNVLVQSPNGTYVEIPRSQLKKAEAAGGKLIR